MWIASYRHATLAALAMTQSVAILYEASELPGDLLLGVAFDDVADLDVVEILDVETAVHAGGDFLDVVLVTLQGAESARVDHDAIADDADLRVTGDLAVQNHTAGDGADLADLEGFADFEVAGNHLQKRRKAHDY